MGDWLSEDEHFTYYDVSVTQTYKGNVPEEIVLLQDGTSKGTVKGYPLFIAGDQLLVFLKEASGTEYIDAYWIIGAYTTVLDVAADDEGTEYFIDRMGLLGESINSEITNYAADMALITELDQNLIERDELWAEKRHRYEYVFLREDVEEWFEDNQKNK